MFLSFEYRSVNLMKRNRQIICSFIFIAFLVTVTGTTLADSPSLSIDNVVIGIDEAGNGTTLADSPALSIDNVVIGIDEAGNHIIDNPGDVINYRICLLYTSPSPRDGLLSRMPSSA